MGTLFQQPNRSYYDVDFDKDVRYACEKIQKIAKDTKMSVSDVIEIYKIETHNRAINCYVADGDAKDEQLSGFGELFESFNSKLDDLMEILRSKSEDEYEDKM